MCVILCCSGMLKCSTNYSKTSLQFSCYSCSICWILIQQFEYFGDMKSIMGDLSGMISVNYLTLLKKNVTHILYIYYCP